METFSVLDKNHARAFMHSFFRTFPQWKDRKTGKLTDLSSVIKAFHSEVVQEVANYRYGVELPERMGKLMVVAYKMNRPYPDFSDLDNIRPHVNNHTDGLRCRIYYTNRGAKYSFKDKIVWSFSSERGFRKVVSNSFSKAHHRYIFNDDRQLRVERVNAFHEKRLQEDRINKFLLTYNEFEL